jgi:hypothetical protein
MAKPIFILHIPISLVESTRNIDDIKKNLDSKLTDYHVIVNIIEKGETKYECLNDCKGLKDVDIEKLIKDLK